MSMTYEDEEGRVIEGDEDDAPDDEPWEPDERQLEEERQYRNPPQWNQ